MEERLIRPGAVWHRPAAGPDVLLVRFVVILPPELVDELGVPAPPGWECALLLGIDSSGEPWTRAGDPSASMGLVAGFPEEPVSLASRMPYVARGWPQHWIDGPLPAMVPERLPKPVELVR